jgi:ATP adenylyltransferase
MRHRKKNYNCQNRAPFERTAQHCDPADKTKEWSGGMDKMDRVFAPWRMEYILSNSDNNEKKGTGCIFCDFPGEHEDEKRLILHRGKYCFVILNAFPYNPGHLMVVPYRHTNDLPGLAPEELGEMMATVQTAVMVLKKVMDPQGFNIGMNLGKVAGAGIDQHLHIHIVPRWNGDTNFMPVLGGVRVVSEALNNTWKRVKEAWPQ